MCGTLAQAMSRRALSLFFGKPLRDRRPLHFQETPSSARPSPTSVLGTFSFPPRRIRRALSYPVLFLTGHKRRRRRGRRGGGEDEEAYWWQVGKDVCTRVRSEEEEVRRRKGREFDGGRKGDERRSSGRRGRPHPQHTGTCAPPSPSCAFDHPAHTTKTLRSLNLDRSDQRIPEDLSLSRLHLRDSVAASGPPRVSRTVEKR